MTFSTDKIPSQGDNDNTGPIRRRVTECSGKQGEMPSAKCQRVTWVPEGAEGDSLALNYVMKYECLWDVIIHHCARGEREQTLGISSLHFLTVNFGYIQLSGQ